MTPKTDGEGKKSPILLHESTKDRLRKYGMKGDVWEEIIKRLMDVADGAQKLTQTPLACPKCGTMVYPPGGR